MDAINIHEAKTHLSRLVERVAGGETLTIAKAGKVMAKLVPIDAQPAHAPRRTGFLNGQVEVPDDFDRMGDETISRLFGL